MVTISACERVLPDMDAVAAGVALGDAAADAVLVHESAEIDLRGMLGLSSSVFNVAIIRLVERIGVEATRDRVRWRFASAIQERVWKRSSEAVMAAAAAGEIPSRR